MQRGAEGMGDAEEHRGVWRVWRDVDGAEGHRGPQRGIEGCNKGRHGGCGGMQRAWRGAEDTEEQRDNYSPLATTQWMIIGKLEV